MAHTPFWPWCPVPGASRSTKLAVDQTNYGDGYVHRSTRGLNPVRPSWQSVFPFTTLDHLTEMDGFLGLNACAGFWMRPPDATADVFVTVDNWAATISDRNLNSGIVGTLSVTFMQNFNPQGTAELTQGSVSSVNTIAQMRALTRYANSLIVQGYYTGNDGGGGTFMWDGTSLASDDGVLAFRPDAVPPAAPGRYIRITNGKITPEMGGAMANSVFPVSDAFERAFNAAKGMIFECGRGVYDCDRSINGPAGVTWRILTGSEVTWRLAPFGTVWVTFQGALGPQHMLSADAHALGAAAPWIDETDYTTDNRCAISGIAWRALAPHHSASLPDHDNSRQLAFRSDELDGYWERTNLKTATDISDLKPGDTLFIQHNVPFESLAGGSVEGESVKVNDITGGTINLRNMLHYDYLVSKSAFFRKAIPLDDIVVEGGGKLSGRTDMDNNNNIGLFFNCCQRVAVRGMDMSYAATCLSFRDVLTFDVSGNFFHDGQGLAYGNAISDGCLNGQIHDNVGESVRHFATASSEPNRAGPRGLRVYNNRMNVSRRFLPPSATSPYGGTGDAFDVHQSCDDVWMDNNDCSDASGSCYHVECRNYSITNNRGDGGDYLISAGNNTTGAGCAIIKGNKGRNLLTSGITIRVGTTGANYRRIDVSDNEIEGVGSFAYFFTGLAGKRLRNLTFRNNYGTGSHYGAYLALMEFVDNPNVIGNHMEPTLTSQQALAIWNASAGVTAANTITQPIGSVASALFFSDLTNSALRVATSVGNAELVVPDDSVMPDGGLAGTYRITCTDATALGAELWNATDPNAVSVGTATTGVPFNFGGVVGTIVAGTVGSAVNDAFTYTACLPSNGMTVVGNVLYAPSPGLNRGIFMGTTVKNFVVASSNNLSQAATPITVGAGSGHTFEAKPRTAVITTNANTTWTNTTSARIRRHVGPLTADRNVVLAKLNATDGNGPVIVNAAPTHNLVPIDEFTGASLAPIPPGGRAAFAYYANLGGYGVA